MLRGTAGSRSFATLRQVVLKKNTTSPFEAFEVAALKASPSAKDKSLKLKLLGSVVTAKDVSIMRGTADAVGKPVGQVGLFEVLDAGSSARFQRGDKVQTLGGVGAWQSELLAPEASVSKVAAGVTAQNFADFLGHAQAVQMLKGLKSGDTVAVTEAQSPLGLGVVRVGKKMGLKVVAIVAPRAQADKALGRLKEAGAHIVAAEEYVDKSYVVSQAFRRLLSDIPQTRVVINTVGSLVAHELARTLGNGGTMFITGGSPFTLPASLFVDRKILVRGADEPTAADFEEAATLLNGLDKVATPSVAFDMGDVSKAVDAVGFGPVSLLKV